MARHRSPRLILPVGHAREHRRACRGSVTRQDVVVADQFAHNSIDEGLKLAKAPRGPHGEVRAQRPGRARRKRSARFRRTASRWSRSTGSTALSGKLPPLAEFRRVACEHNACLYVDDAAATGVLGESGAGTVRESLGDYDNVLTVGLALEGPLVSGRVRRREHAVRPSTCWKLRSTRSSSAARFRRRTSEAVVPAVDIVGVSGVRQAAHLRSTANVRRLADGAKRLGLAVMGGLVPIVSVLVGAEEATLKAGSSCSTAATTCSRWCSRRCRTGRACCGCR